MTTSISIKKVLVGVAAVALLASPLFAMADSHPVSGMSNDEIRAEIDGGLNALGSKRLNDLLKRLRQLEQEEKAERRGGNGGASSAAGVIGAGAGGTTSVPSGYDLAADPGDVNNIAANLPNDADAARGKLSECFRLALALAGLSEDSSDSAVTAARKAEIACLQEAFALLGETPKERAVKALINIKIGRVAGIVRIGAKGFAPITVSSGDTGDTKKRAQNQNSPAVLTVDGCYSITTQQAKNIKNALAAASNAVNRLLKILTGVKVSTQELQGVLRDIQKIKLYNSGRACNAYLDEQAKSANQFSATLLTYNQCSQESKDTKRVVDGNIIWTDPATGEERNLGPAVCNAANGQYVSAGERTIMCSNIPSLTSVNNSVTFTKGNKAYQGGCTRENTRSAWEQVPPIEIDFTDFGQYEKSSPTVSPDVSVPPPSKQLKSTAAPRNSLLGSLLKAFGR